MRLALLVALAVAATAFAQSDLPRRKSGLWLLKFDSRSLGEVQFHECVERNLDEFLAKPRDRSCSTPVVRRQGTGYLQEMECKQGGTETIRAFVSGNFDSA